MPRIDDDGSAKTFIRLVNDVHLSIVRLFNYRASELGLTRAHWRVVSGLYRHDGMTQTELADTIAMARSPLGKVVDRLEQVGWIERRPDADDRRVKRLYLTSAADAVIEPAREIADELESAALAPLSETEKGVLTRSLDAIRAVLNAHLKEEVASSGAR